MRAGHLLASVLACGIGLAAALPSAPLHDPVSAAQGLVSRVLGPSFVSQFSFEVIPADAGHDAFELDYAGGLVVVRGNTGVAIASGLFHYLKYWCNATVSWGGDQLNLPAPLPAVTAPVHVRTRVEYRYAWNVCTASYSGYPWGWARWEREIDLMALWGVNLALMFTGQEFVWQQLYASLGLTNAEIQAFLAGPAFLAWQRMGNLQLWGGPLDDDWIEGQRQLQHQILDRARSFGMISVLPGFSGHVPGAVQRIFPQANLTQNTAWGKFNATYTDTYLLNPTDPTFQTIGRRFYELLIAEFGTDHVYNSDTFNEMPPQSSDPTYLMQANQAVFQAMNAVDRNATYLMQAWLFHETFWTPPRVEAYLSGVPNDSMLILDLNAEQEPLWSLFDSFYGKPFIWCLLHNFGGRRGMYGPLDVIASAPIATQGNSSSMVGIGYTPEAIDHNPVVYELLNEVAWHPELSPTSPLDVPAWVAQYARRRYGVESPSAAQAWQLLLQAGYSQQWVQTAWSVLEHVPGLNMASSRTFNATLYVQALRLLYAAGAQQEGGLQPANSPTYLYDLVDLTRQVMADLFVDGARLNSMAFLMASSAQQNTSAGFTATSAFLQQLLVDLDTLLSSNAGFLLGTWIEGARNAPNTSSSSEADLREFNARNQITLWGPNGEINDYAAKHWAGLVGDYYLRRWTYFLTTLGNVLAAHTTFNITSYQTGLLAVEQGWSAETKAFPTTPTGDVMTLVSQALARYATGNPALFTAVPGMDCPSHDLIPFGGAWTTDLDQLMVLCASDPDCQGFNTAGYLKNTTVPLRPSPSTTFYRKIAA